MKKIFISLLFSFIFLNNVIAQVPQGFNYQGVARNNNGDPIRDKTVNFRFSILNGSTVGAAEYMETQSVITNGSGIFSTIIGNGIPIVGVFKNITWGAGSKFLRVELDPSGGQNYVLIGTTQLLSVPYALHSGSSTPGPQGLKGDKGDTGDKGDIGETGAPGPTYSAGNGIQITSNVISTVPVAFNVVSLVFQNLTQDVYNKIDFTSDGTASAGDFDDTDYFSLTNDEFTAPSAGYYHFDGLITLDYRGVPNNEAYMTFAVNGSPNASNRFYEISGNYPILQLSMTLKLNAGDKVSLQLQTLENTTTMGANAYGVVRFSGFKIN